MSASDSESGSYTGSSSSEDSIPRPKLIRPKFIPKSKRTTTATTANPPKPRSPSPETLAAQKKAATDALVQDQLDRDAASRHRQRNHWEDRSDSAASVDTTDDADLRGRGGGVEAARAEAAEACARGD